MSFPILILVLVLCLPSFAQAQVGINTDNSDPDPSAMLDVQSTEKGILIPRMTSGQRTIISNPATGLLVFDISTSSFWFFDGSAWEELTAAADHLGDHTATQNIALDGNYLSGDGDSEGIYVKNDGSVGIATSDPQVKFHIEGGNDATLTSNGYMILGDPGSTNTVFDDNEIMARNNGAVSPLYLQIHGGDVIMVRDSGSVGIGTSTPSEALEVVGTVKADAFEGDGSLLTGISADDADADPANELQALSISEDTIKLTDGGFVVIPSDKVPDTSLPIRILFQGGEIYVHPTDNATAVDWSTAQTTCANLVAHGFSDWYLPTRLELDAMYKQSYLITGLSQTDVVKYWSDTELDTDNAYTQRLDYGGPDPDPKTDTSGHNCRCIRAD